MMGRINRKLIIMAVLATTLGGCADEALGPEFLEIGEEESGLQFYAPGFENGYRNIIYGQDERFVKRTVGIYGPREGEYPHGQLTFVEMPPRFYLSRDVPPEDTISEWNQFENRVITLGPVGYTVNKIGRINYAAFLADDVACAVFRQLFGTSYGTGGGKQLLDGYYCKGIGPMMAEGEVEALVKVVGHRKYGALTPPRAPESGESYAQSAEAYVRVGSYDRAVEELTEAIRREPGNAKYFRARGNAYRGWGDYDRAIQDYNEAIRLRPDYANAFRSRGVAYRLKGDSDQAIRDHTEAIRFNPNYKFAFRSRGLAYADKKDYDRAIQDYTEAIRLDPAYASAYMSRGSAYGEIGEHDKALRDLNEAIRLVPDDAGAYNNRCWLYGRMRRPNNALTDCDKSLSLRPDNPATLDSRALAYWLLGNYEQARRDLERAREIQPDFLKGRDRFRDFESMF